MDKGAWFKRLKSRFHNRPDSEHEQALVRTVIVLAVTLYLLIADQISTISAPLHHGLVVLGTCLLFSLSLFILIARNPGISIARRIVSMIGDMGMITYMHYYYGETMAPLYIVYLWVSSGYGLRYGARYLVAATVLAALGFILVLLNNDYWRANSTTGWGLWIGLIILPVYVASLLAKLSRALNAAEAANLAKSRFIANMSHEIRTPINGVIGLLEMLNATRLTDQQRSLVYGAQSSTTTLRYLLEEVLDMSKIASGRISRIQRPFDLHAVVKSVLEPFEYEAGIKNLRMHRHFDSDCPYHLIGDEPHLRQVLVNLISNAVKFTQQGEIHIRISADQVRPSKIALRIEVSDTGIGISEEAQHFIFEPFRQEDEDITRRFGGSGLGMNIAKQLTEHMGGKLSVTSIQGQGSTFTLRLPFERQNNPTRCESLHFPDGILIVSHDDHLIDQLRQWLEQWGVRCSVQPELSSSTSSSTILLDSRSPPRSERLFNERSTDTEQDRILVAHDISPSFDIMSAKYASVLPLPVDPDQLHTLLHSLQPDTPTHARGDMESSQGQPSRTSTLRVLVADDNKINQLVTGNTLERAGHQVFVVDDGESAIDVLQTDRFDLAIVDMMMPGKSGLDVIKFFRDHASGREPMPFILLTASISEEIRMTCEALDAHYLSKPLYGHTLLTKIQEIMT